MQREILYTWCLLPKEFVSFVFHRMLKLRLSGKQNLLYSSPWCRHALISLSALLCSDKKNQQHSYNNKIIVLLKFSNVNDFKIEKRCLTLLLYAYNAHICITFLHRYHCFVYYSHFKCNSVSCNLIGS